MEVIKGKSVSIRTFDNLVGMYMGRRPEACGMSGVCSCQFVVEADGSVYPCDFYVFDEYKIGNLLTHELEDMANSQVVKNFIEVSRYVSPECRECRWYSICRGGCRRLREPFVDGKPALNIFCNAYKEFFEYASGRMHKMAQIISRL